MNDTQRRKLDMLKAANKKYAGNLNLQRNILLQECLRAIGTYQTAGEEETAGILAIIHGTQIEQLRHATIPTIAPGHSYAVVWDEAKLPIIVCSGADILAHWEDVTAVAFDTCLVDLAEKRAVLIRN